jgi:hypothetical protein
MSDLEIVLSDKPDYGRALRAIHAAMGALIDVIDPPRESTEESAAWSSRVNIPGCKCGCRAACECGAWNRVNPTGVPASP